MLGQIHIGDAGDPARVAQQDQGYVHISNHIYIYIRYIFKLIFKYLINYMDVACMQSVALYWCNNAVVRGLRMMNSQIMHMAIDNCKNVAVRNVYIRAPSGSPNTDGIHIEASTGVTITASTIMTGDDCISIGEGAKNLWIERIACGPGHGIR